MIASLLVASTVALASVINLTDGSYTATPGGAFSVSLGGGLLTWTDELEYSWDAARSMYVRGVPPNESTISFSNPGSHWNQTNPTQSGTYTKP